VRMTKKRQALLDRIKTEAGVEVVWEDLNTAPLSSLQLVSIRLQLAAGGTNGQESQVR
jgi:hypothetical protein